MFGDFLRAIKWRYALPAIAGVHGASAVSTAIPHGERTLEYPYVLAEIGRIANGRRVKVLDVGSGDVSILPLWIRNLGHEVVGCDLRASLRTIPDVKFMQADVVRDDIAGKFDVLTCISVIEHVGVGHYSGETHADVDFLQSFHRLMADNARVILTFPFGSGGVSQNQDRIDAFRVYTAAGSRKLVAAAAFEIERAAHFALKQGYWSPCSEAEAGARDSTRQVTALCCLTLREA